MTTKSFLKLLFTLIIIFSLTAMSILLPYVITSGGSFFGYEFTSAKDNLYVNTMLMGLDKGGTRSDVMIFAQLNLVDGKLNMLQIPRDTYMPNNGRGDRKINSAYGYGKEKTVFKEVGKLLGVNVDRYIIVDTSGFRDLIDTIGGVDFYVPQDMNYEDPDQDLYIHLKEGQQHLDGDKAEQLVRFRSYPTGDIGRMQVQSEFIGAVIDEVLSLSNVFKVSDLVEDFSNIVDTNFTMNEMLNYAPYILSLDRENFCTHQLQGSAQYINGISYFVADDAANKEIIDGNFRPLKDEEIDIQKSILGHSPMAEDIKDIKLTKSFFNKFTSVDIIDASGKDISISAISTKLKEYGFNVRNISISASEYSETTVVSKRRNNAAASVAKIMGLEEYIHNSSKSTGSDVTIIIGKDYE
jgi:LCP family protein required for cell wall assembly